ncbi:type II secretion system protein GspM [Arhodomonas sp. AD133]|uniref:type II secretion system protein GspM n=1 Tax=Arhodomonas sp. AD133 TaxID=3415009 RepID=UPI003EBD4620
MSPEQLGQRERRVLAVGLLVAVLLGLALLIVQPLIGAYTGYRAEIADQRFRLERFKKVVASLPSLEKEVSVLRQRVDDSGLFLSRETPDLAAAELQQLLEKVIGEHGGSINSVQVMGPSEDENFTRIRVRADIRADSGTLAAVLRSLETGRPVVMIDDVTISPEQSRRRSEQRFSGELKVRLELNAFMARTMAAGDDT